MRYFNDYLINWGVEGDKKDQGKSSATVAATQNHNEKLFLKNYSLNI